jgi:hypothetical protein
MALTIDGSDPSGDLGDLLDDKLDVATAVSDYLPIAGGKVLQIVRATDSTDRSTTSGTFVDANISVTITPQKSTSAVLLIWSFYANPANNSYLVAQITDNSNSAISGAQLMITGDASSTNLQDYVTGIGYATPATTSAVTFKGRFRASPSAVTVSLVNSGNTGQLYAIEVSA